MPAAPGVGGRCWQSQGSSELLQHGLMEVPGHGESQHQGNPEVEEGLASTGPWRLQRMLGHPAFCAWVCPGWAVPLWFHPSQVMGVSRLTLLISNECLRASPATEHSGPSRARAPSTSNTDQRATHYGERH